MRPQQALELRRHSEAAHALHSATDACDRAKRTASQDRKIASRPADHDKMMHAPIIPDKKEVQ